jgi:alkylhydroperoxidase family enzyme
LPGDPRLAALCSFAVKVTGEAASIRRDDIDALGPFGLDDAAIHDAIQVIAYFNYINRIADCGGDRGRAGVGLARLSGA